MEVCTELSISLICGPWCLFTRRPALQFCFGLASPQDSYVAKALDLGVEGIVVPQVKTAEEAKRAVLASKFAPLGERGLGGVCPADRFGDMRVEEFIKQENERVMTIIQIENAEALEQLDDILKVERKACA